MTSKLLNSDEVKALLIVLSDSGQIPESSLKTLFTKVDELPDRGSIDIGGGNRIQVNTDYGEAGVTLITKDGDEADLFCAVTRQAVESGYDCFPAGLPSNYDLRCLVYEDPYDESATKEYFLDTKDFEKSFNAEKTGL